MADKAMLELYKVESESIKRSLRYLNKQKDNNKLDAMGKWALNEMIGMANFRLNQIKDNIAKEYAGDSK